MITAIGETIDPMRGEHENIHAFGFGDNEVKDKRKKVQLPTLLRYENKYQAEKNIASF